MNELNSRVDLIDTRSQQEVVVCELADALIRLRAAAKHSHPRERERERAREYVLCECVCLLVAVDG